MKSLLLFALTLQGIVEVFSSRQDMSCCSYGIQFLKSKSKTKGNNDARMCFGQPRPGKSVVCQSLGRICCLNEQQYESCKEGERSANMHASTCHTSSFNVPFFGTALKCCECCQLGKQRAKSGNCNINTLIDRKCKMVFENCCKKAKKDVDKPKTCADLKCSQQCEMTKSGPMCTCQKGYMINPADSRSCKDIDECKTEKVRCFSGHQCHNIIGSYICRKLYKAIKCPKGYEQVLDSCRDIDECDTGTHQCRNGTHCQNILGGYQCVEALKNKCKAGYFRMQGFCIDLNECKTKPCRPIVERCVNTPGSYRCLKSTGCPHGYREKNSGCVDINECMEKKNICKGLGERCINILGSYRCACKYGFRHHPVSKLCKDVDECKIGRRCEQKCYNTIGSFQCACTAGFKLHQNKYTCQDINECSKSNVCKSNERCVNTKGSFSCMPKNCPTHYRARGKGTCMRVCLNGQDCRNLPRLIKTFVVSRNKNHPLRLPITINIKNVKGATHVEFKLLTKGNEEGLFTTQKKGTSKVLLMSTKGNFASLDPFSANLVLSGSIIRRSHNPVKIEYHFLLNFY